MADVLDQSDIDEALKALPGWRSEDGKLVKAVPAEDASQDSLEKAVMQVADQLNHHPDIARTAGEMTFTLWTHSAGGVTSKDVDLAGRIDQTLSGPGQAG